jgi:hypothetical protein
MCSGVSLAGLDRQKSMIAKNGTRAPSASPAFIDSPF